MKAYVVVPLTKGKVTLIDPEDYPFAEKYGWYLVSTRGKCYARATIEGKGRFLHRLILDAPLGMEVDHINGDGLDNRRCNLRLATARQNRVNSAPDRYKPRSGFRGVKQNSENSWAAIIGDSGRGGRRIGSYSTPEAAARAYDTAALEEYGEFAVLNFPEERSAA